MASPQRGGERAGEEEREERKEGVRARWRWHQAGAGLRLRYALVGEGNEVDAVVTTGGTSGARAGERLARALVRAWPGATVLVWDRRNTNESSVAWPREADGAMPEVDAEDLAEVLRRAVRVRRGGAVLVGKSSGARVSALVAARHPSLVGGLVLAPPTGGDVAVEMLVQMYYDGPKEKVRRGEVGAVAKEWGLDSPDAVASLGAVDPTAFARVCDASAAWMRRFAGEAMVGLTDAELRAVALRLGVDRVAVAHSGDASDVLHDLAHATRVALVAGVHRLDLVPDIFASAEADERLARDVVRRVAWAAARRNARL